MYVLYLNNGNNRRRNDRSLRDWQHNDKTDLRLYLLGTNRLSVGDHQFICWWSSVYLLVIISLSVGKSLVYLLVIISLSVGDHQFICWWSSVYLLVIISLSVGDHQFICWWSSVYLLVIISLSVGDHQFICW